MLHQATMILWNFNNEIDVFLLIMKWSSEAAKLKEFNSITWPTNHKKLSLKPLLQSGETYSNKIRGIYGIYACIPIALMWVLAHESFVV